MNKSKSSLKRDDVLHLAKLATIQVTDKEVEKYVSQLGETITYVENLKELDTENVVATNQTIPLSNVGFEDGAECTRMLTGEEALSNSRSKKGQNFIVKRIIG